MLSEEKSGCKTKMRLRFGFEITSCSTRHEITTKNKNSKVWTNDYTSRHPAILLSSPWYAFACSCSCLVYWENFQTWLCWRERRSWNWRDNTEALALIIWGCRKWKRLKGKAVKSIMTSLTGCDILPTDTTMARKFNDAQ